MDEEELEQSNKVDISSFFGSIQSIDRVAKNALNSSNTSLKASRSNLDLIKAIQASFESLRAEVQEISRYILIEQDERSKILAQREQAAAQREDDIQKGIFNAEDTREKALTDDKPFSGKNRFLEGITGGLSNIIEQNQDLIAGAGAATILGAIPFNLGRLVPGSGDADTVNAKLTPGEFVIPKDTVEEYGSNFFNDLIKKNENSFANVNEEFFFDTSTPKTNKNKHPRLQNFENFRRNYGPGSTERKEEYYNQVREVITPKMFQEFSNMNKSGKSNEDDDFSDPFFDDGVGFDELINGDAPTYKQLTEGFSTYDEDFDYFVKPEKKEDKGIFGGLFGGNKKNENVRSDEKEGRGLFGAIGGTIDAATGGLTDLDRRGGKPFGLMRGITGSIDAMTGGLTDLDRRGGKPFGTMRLATGVADAMTGNLFDFDRRGRGEEEKKKLRDKDGRYIGDNVRKKNFQKMMDKNLNNKASQLPMETTVNPDGSITSEGSGTFIGGELVKPGEPLTPMQRAAMTMNIQMGNTYSSEMMEKYNDAGGAPSKEEFDNYEKEKSKSVKPDKEKSKNIKPEQTLGEKFMNMFRGDKKEKGSQLLSSAPSSKYSPNTSISSDDSIKTAARGIMQPPQGGGQSETVVLPEQSGGSPTGSIDQTSTSPFTSSTPSHSELGPTSSPVPFIDVISNQYLSVV